MNNVTYATAPNKPKRGGSKDFNIGTIVKISGLTEGQFRIITRDGLINLHTGEPVAHEAGKDITYEEVNEPIIISRT